MKKRQLLTIKIITLFPKFVEDFAESFGIVKRAVKLKLLSIKAVNLRSFGLGDRQVVDGRPYGGGVGMVLRADVLYKAIKSTNPKSENRNPKKSKVILLSPQGKPFTQKDAVRLSKLDNLVLVCGRYEGFDERVRQFVDEEISIGDYVLMGGELPALVISEAVMRLRPGILGKDESSVGESFADGLLEHPQYTKPERLQINSKSENRNSKKSKIYTVPKVLLAGHHKNINEWRKTESEKRTKKRRPDLVK